MEMTEKVNDYTGTTLSLDSAKKFIKDDHLKTFDQQLELQDPQSLSFENETFDCIVDTFGLEQVTDP